MSDANEAEVELLHTYDPETHVPVERALIAEAFDFIVEHGEGAPTDLERRLRAALSDGAGRSEADIKTDAWDAGYAAGFCESRHPFNPDECAPHENPYRQEQGIADGAKS